MTSVPLLSAAMIRFLPGNVYRVGSMSGGGMGKKQAAARDNFLGKLCVRERKNLPKAAPEYCDCFPSGRDRLPRHERIDTERKAADGDKAPVDACGNKTLCGTAAVRSHRTRAHDAHAESV